MGVYIVKIPKFIQKVFKNLVWSFSVSKKEIYLTFDDGPTPEITTWVLSILKDYNAKATFFCIGKNVQNHPEIFQKIISHGHGIGNHTHNHLNGWKVNNAVYIQNILKAEKELYYKLNTEDAKLFRPPYGKIKPSQVQLLHKKGYKIIMWDVLSADFDTKISKEKCLNNVLKTTENGSIVIFHDSIKAEKNMKYTLPKILEHFSQEGYAFKSLKTTEFDN